MAISGLSRYTPASSLVSKPTSTLGSVGRGKRRKTESSNPGLSFAAQPAALTMAVSFTDGVKPHLAVVRFDYSDVPPFVLACSAPRSEEHTSELQSRFDLVCRLLLEKKKLIITNF